MITLDGQRFDERELIRQAIAGLRPHHPYGVSRWLLAEHVFGTTSAVARALCREFGFDPDEIIDGR